ncbi:DUF4381 domain-containing protein [Acidisphaera sp. S103]|uniref:DUF4381 domain-containing protein n=1 Tax=Acidisphaera sp. S103 TaxID=1747223 RepID=UPI00131EBB93|nr:DUF4381 domain-containing protein [Acidisphaera sp. S103]
MAADPADLANLHDIVLPPAVPYWPPALGWWIVGFTLLAMALLVLARSMMRYRHNAYRREALRELDAIGPIRDSATAQDVSAVLKRVALVTFGREQVASLSGRFWLAFLDRTGPGTVFGQMLPLPGFDGSADGDMIAAAARRWIRHHHRNDGSC